MDFASPWRGGLEGARYKECAAKPPEDLGKPPAGSVGGRTMVSFHVVFTLSGYHAGAYVFKEFCNGN